MDVDSIVGELQELNRNSAEQLAVLEDGLIQSAFVSLDELFDALGVSSDVAQVYLRQSCVDSITGLFIAIPAVVVDGDHSFVDDDLQGRWEVRFRKFNLDDGVCVVGGILERRDIDVAGLGRVQAEVPTGDLMGDLLALAGREWVGLEVSFAGDGEQCGTEKGKRSESLAHGTSVAGPIAMPLC